MASTTPPTDSYRVELYLRQDTYGTYDAQQRVLDRLDELEDDGVLEMSGYENWQAIQTMEYEHREGALATYDEFQDWARHNGVRLEPAFDQRFQTSIDRTDVTQIVVFPVIALALYEGDQLQATFPCSDGDEHFTVQDCLSAFESGNVGRFLTRFAPRTVGRTAPHLDEATG